MDRKISSSEREVLTNAFINAYGFGIGDLTIDGHPEVLERYRDMFQSDEDINISFLASKIFIVGPALNHYYESISQQYRSEFDEDEKLSLAKIMRCCCVLRDSITELADDVGIYTSGLI